MGIAALPLATATAKQTWFWEITLAVVGVLLALNLLLFLTVFARRFRELHRGRRSAEFHRECEQLLDELDSGTGARDREWLRARIARFDELERPVAATMLIQRVRTASSEHRVALLEALRDVGATELLLRSTRRHVPWRRTLAIRTLGLLGAEEAVPALIERLSDSSRNVREAAVRALGRIGDGRALPALADLYGRPGRVGMGIVYEALPGLGPPSAQVFTEGLASADEAIRVTSCFGIASVLEPEAARPVLERMLGDAAAPVRAAACKILGRIGGAPIPSRLADATRDEQRTVRREAVSALGSYDDPQALQPLLAALEDPDRDVALRAGESLVRLGRLPNAGARARAAIEETRAWPLATALELDSLGAL
jgi:HEAT repeat protein